jgi:hypothetical protein
MCTYCDKATYNLLIFTYEGTVGGRGYATGMFNVIAQNLKQAEEFINSPESGMGKNRFFHSYEEYRMSGLMRMDTSETIHIWILVEVMPLRCVFQSPRLVASQSYESD